MCYLRCPLDILLGKCTVTIHQLLHEIDDNVMSTMQTLGNALWRALFDAVEGKHSAEYLMLIMYWIDELESRVL